MIQWLKTSASMDTSQYNLREQIELFMNEDHVTILRVIVESISDGLILIDKDGYVLYINSIGAEILKLNAATVRNKHVSTIVDFKPIILNTLNKQKGYIEKEFFLESPSMGTLHFIKSAIILFNNNDEVIGVIDTFRRVDTVHNTIAKITGAQAKFSFNDIIGQDPVFLETIKLSQLASKTESNVLLEGESGTGKEMFAHAIHNRSPKTKGPFIIVNCASLPKSLIESELFGHESGSFTGAKIDGYAGKFEQANNGTIFLDEIGELPLDMQSKLLRVIQDKTFTRIGGKKNITTNARIITATNRNLFQEVEQHNFRKDLYYRLNVLRIQLPSLKERQSDIPILTSYFVKKISERLHHNPPEIDKKVLKIFQEYIWPGNIRELENAIERALIISTNNIITTKHIPAVILKKNDIYTEDSLHLSLNEVENLEIKKTLFQYDGNITRCAQALGISRNTLYRKIKKMETKTRDGLRKETVPKL